MPNTQPWTASDIPDLTGKTAMITGGNSGVGFETAVELARHGATTIIACRSASRGEAALDRIKESGAMLPDQIDASRFRGFGLDQCVRGIIYG